MLQGIKSASQSAKSESAVELLTGCHDRIRHFTAVVRNLAHAEGSPLPDISSAAESAYRYFTVALPLHEADEEESMRPRLLQSSAPEITGALDAMTHQHQAIDDLIERLLPLLVLLSNSPSKLPDAHGELCTISKALDEVFRGHLDLEERVLFPAITNQLGPEAQIGILREMQARRKQG